MLSVQEEAVPGTPAPRPLLELRTSVVAGGREFLQTQLLSAEFVLTRIGRGAILFLRESGQRYTVDGEQRVLRPMGEGGGQGVDPAAPLVTVAAMSVRDDPANVEGYTCRRVSVESRVGRVTLSTESYYAHIPGVDRTALHAERLLSAPAAHPAHLLQPDEVLIRATTIVRQGDFEQTQMTRLLSIQADPEDGEAEMEVVSYPRADTTA
jgi:hypothetical protein